MEDFLFRERGGERGDGFTRSPLSTLHSPGEPRTHPRVWLKRDRMGSDADADSGADEGGEADSEEASERDDELSDNENEKLAQVPRGAWGREASLTGE